MASEQDEKTVFFLLSFLIIYLPFYFFSPKKVLAPSLPPNQPTFPKKAPSYFQKLQYKATESRAFALKNGLSARFSFLIDMGLPAGKKRFFLYDHRKGTVLEAGLVSHGSCRSRFLAKPLFSNIPESGCSTLGRYKVGYRYQGNFGKAYKLHGLDSSNANAFQRLIVLHGYHAVPDEEVHPFPIVNSPGCPMVSYRFLEKLSAIIEEEKKPLLLWTYQ